MIPPINKSPPIMGNIHLEISSDIEGATPISAEPADKERLYKMSKDVLFFNFSSITDFSLSQL